MADKPTIATIKTRLENQSAAQILQQERGNLDAQSIDLLEEIAGLETDLNHINRDLKPPPQFKLPNDFKLPKESRKQPLLLLVAAVAAMGFLWLARVPDPKPLDPTQVTRGQDPTPDSTTDIFSAIEGNQLQLVDRLVTPTTLKSVNTAGQTPLMLAAVEDLPDMVTLLLRRGTEVNHQDSNGTSALMLAAGNGNAIVVKHLLDGGADPNLRDDNGRSALDLASLYQFSECIEVLESHNPDNEDSQ